MKNKQQLVPALLERMDTAWTFLIVSIALMMILGLAGLRSCRLIRDSEDDEDDPRY